MYRSLGPSDLRVLLEGEAPPQLIDVRTPLEVARGSIAGSRNIELSTLPARAGELDPDAPCVFYCLSGARSAHACAYLAQRGFRDLYNLEGGIAAWAKAGQSLVA